MEGPPLEFAEAERSYPEFSSLMAGPFNQDWRDESETAEEIWQRELFSLSVEEMEESLAELKTAGRLRSLTVRLEAAIDEQRVTIADADEVPLEQLVRPRNEETP